MTKREQMYKMLIKTAGHESDIDVHNFFISYNSCKGIKLQNCHVLFNNLALSFHFKFIYLV